MIAKWVTASAAAAAVLGFASLTSAVPRELVGIDSSGNAVSSGWTWDVSTALEPYVNLVFIRLEGNNFFFEKDAVITRTSDPVTITFNRIANNASTLVINDETVTNNSGVDWTGFKMELSSGTTPGGLPNFAFMTHDGSGGIGDFKIDPFATFSFSNNNSTLVLGGGSPVVNGSTWYPGANSDTGLALVANANDTTFTLKETPITGGTTIIPLPAAAWSGLSGLLGLGLVGFAKRVRRHLA
jgi:hypothetical protein